MIDDRTEVIRTLNKILREIIYKTSRTIQIKSLNQPPPVTVVACTRTEGDQGEASLL